MSTSDFREPVSVVTVARKFACTYSLLWQAVTRPPVISMWFEPCRQGADGRYMLDFADCDGDSYAKYVTVLGCESGGSSGWFRFRLQDDGYRDSAVEVRAAATDTDGSTLLLRHLDPPEQLEDGYRSGWADYLDDLGRYLVAGSDGFAKRTPRT